MLRDTSLTYSPPSANDLSVAPDQEAVILLQFIDRNISGFCTYYKNHKDSRLENRISDFLVNYFNFQLRKENQDFPAFSFGKNPSQSSSGKETDVGVVISTDSAAPETIIDFEAKRLPSTSEYKEYVCGDKGGINRFKRGKHGSHLSVCGMFGYVQSRTPLIWIEKVNTWIDELSQTNQDPEIDWCSRDESLHESATFKDVEKLRSEHLRKKSKDTILLWHYFLNLC